MVIKESSVLESVHILIVLSLEQDINLERLNSQRLNSNLINQNQNVQEIEGNSNSYEIYDNDNNKNENANDNVNLDYVDDNLIETLSNKSIISCREDFEKFKRDMKKSLEQKLQA